MKKILENFYKGKKILVTGGAGFIGSYVTESLIEMGAHVTVLDNFSNGTLENLRSVLTRVNVLHADVTSAYSCERATKGQDIVFHLAAFIFVAKSIKNSSFCEEVNVTGTYNILEGCRKNGIKRLVYSSSSAVYGDKNESCSEEDLPNPQTPYAKSKLMGEKLCKNYAADYAMNMICLRYFNVYGDRQSTKGDYAAVVAKFEKCLQEKQPLTVYGNGAQIRDFVHVSKVVDANIKLAFLAQEGSETYNVASGKSINLFQLISKLEKKLNVRREEITFKAARCGDIEYSKADCKKIKQALSRGHNL
jgi:UDP-glucose 4-epimerase